MQITKMIAMDCTSVMCRRQMLIAGIYIYSIGEAARPTHVYCASFSLSHFNFLPSDSQNDPGGIYPGLWEQWSWLLLP